MKLSDSIKQVQQKLMIWLNLHFLMICGINVQWKQPIAYFLVSDSCTGNDLHNIIMSTIVKFQNISLNVKAFITDQGFNFLIFSKKVFVSPSRPYFYVNGQKVIYRFDPPHLLKSTRNMFFKHNFINDENYIDNKHLIHFYNEDIKMNIRTAPKSTHAHIYPEPFEKMRVYLAAQLLVILLLLLCKQIKLWENYHLILYKRFNLLKKWTICLIYLIHQKHQTVKTSGDLLRTHQIKENIYL